MTSWNSALIVDASRLFAEALSGGLARRGVQTRWATYELLLGEIAWAKGPSPDVVFVGATRSRTETSQVVRILRRRHPGIPFLLLVHELRGWHHHLCEVTRPASCVTRDLDLDRLMKWQLPRGGSSHVGVGTYMTRHPVESVTEVKAGVDRVEATLSNREVEVLGCLAAGLTMVAIAAELEISVNTVRTHVRNIYRKLQVHRRLDILPAAEARGLARPAVAGRRSVRDMA